MLTTNSMVTDVQSAAVAHAVGKTYPGGVVALDRIDLTIRRGQTTAFLGNNGSGKTTLLKVLAGILAPSAGSVQVFGADVTTRSRLLSWRIGYVAQAVELDPEMTGAETLGLFATLYGVSPSNHHTRITELANAFGLTEHMPRPVASYSGGLRQRLHLAIGLVHEPELLFLDEPTAALDPAGRGLVWELMERHRRRGHTVVVVTHDLAEAAQHCQSIALLHRGKALASGSPPELVAAHATWKLQLELAGGVTEDSPLREKLGSLVGVKKVSVRPRQASLDLTSEEPTAVHRVKDQALSLLVEHKVAVVGFRLQPPDLSSAYFNLTGQALVDSKPRARGEGARGERGRRKPVKEVVP